MDEKLKSENMLKKSSFLCLCYTLRAIRTGRCREWRYADYIFSAILQNAPFRSQISKIFFASGGTGALTPNQNPADVPGSELQAVAPATVTFVVDVYCTNMQTLHVQNECGPKKTEATNSCQILTDFKENFSLEDSSENLQ